MSAIPSLHMSFSLNHPIFLVFFFTEKKFQQLNVFPSDCCYDWDMSIKVKHGSLFILLLYLVCVIYLIRLSMAIVQYPSSFSDVQ